jgi:SAM-dependent methyltransferase
MSFADHFSKIAQRYRDDRPRYPAPLFAHLASIAPDRERAWDCACGNGQAAVGLAEHFQGVVATDASAEQIRHGLPHPRVRYGVAPAERSGLAAASVDLVSVAQALHWLPLDAFYAEARRVLRPRGVIAAWGYGLHVIDPAVDRVIEHLYHDLVGPWWSPQRRLIDERFASIPFPFDELEAPELAMAQEWTLDQVRRYLETWSAVQRFRAETGRDPVEQVTAGLAAAWGDPHRPRVVRWPLFMRVGRTASR